MTEREQQLQAALTRVKHWCEAYPVDTFKPPTTAEWTRATQVLRNSDISISNLHASWARHILSGIVKIVDEVLTED